MTVTTTTTIDKLKPGAEYPDGNIQARRHYTDEDINELAASLRGPEGQIRPLLVASHPTAKGAYFVFAGGRRRLAYLQLVKEGKLPKTHEIEIKDHGHISAKEALALSAADNKSLPMHPADQAQTFAELVADQSPEQIAQDRGMTVRAVKQSIALGQNLAPEVLDAWRKGEINIELARIFTLGDKEDQVEQLQKQRAGKHVPSWRRNRGSWSERFGVEAEIRKAFAGNEADAQRFLKFVGEEAATAEGIRVSRDLFREDDKDVAIVHDLPKLKKLAKKKLETRAVKLRDEGWLWVEVSTSANFSDWNYQKSKDKKKAGCIVRIAGTKIEVKSGLVKKTASNSSSNDSVRPHREIEGYEARQAKQHAISAAVGAAMGSNVKLCLAVFCADLGALRNWNSPVTIEPDADNLKITHAHGFDNALTEFLKLDATQLSLVLAQVVAHSVEVQKLDAKLVQMLDAAVVQRGLGEFFDYKEYFGDCSSDHLLKVIAEAMGPDEAKKHKDATENALANFCAARVPNTGWLPKELRTSAYSGPGEKPGAKPAKPKAKAKKSKQPVDA